MREWLKGGREGGGRDCGKGKRGGGKEENREEG